MVQEGYVRELIGLLVGLYISIAVVVFGAACWGIMSGETAKTSPCPVASNWPVWALYRASLWPKTYYDDIGKTQDLGGWLLVHYTPETRTCAQR